MKTFFLGLLLLLAIAPVWGQQYQVPHQILDEGPLGPTTIAYESDQTGGTISVRTTMYEKRGGAPIPVELDFVLQPYSKPEQGAWIDNYFAYIFTGVDCECVVFYGKSTLKTMGKIQRITACAYNGQTVFFMIVPHNEVEVSAIYTVVNKNGVTRRNRFASFYADFNKDW